MITDDLENTLETTLKTQLVEKQPGRVPAEKNKELESVLRSHQTRIRVVGCGGGGNNTVTHLMEVGVKGVETLAVNTDAQDLFAANADDKILIGRNITRGLGGGSNPQIGEDAARENKQEIEECLKNTDMVFVTCGLGGGTGTGSGPVVAEIARNLGALTIAVVTLPFIEEGVMRWDNARLGLEKLRKNADTVIVIQNDRLFEVVPDLPLALAFKVADEILVNAVKGITELVTEKGLVNLDFADVKAIMQNGGTAMIGIGESDGEDRARVAIEMAMQNPLLNVDITGARNALISITGGGEMSLKDAKTVMKQVAEKLHPSARVIWGSRIDSNMGKEIRVLLIVTGFDQNFQQAADSATVSPSARLDRFEHAAAPLREQMAIRLSLPPQESQPESRPGGTAERTAEPAADRSQPRAIATRPAEAVDEAQQSRVRELNAEIASRSATPQLSPEPNRSALARTPEKTKAGRPTTARVQRPERSMAENKTPVPKAPHAPVIARHAEARKTTAPEKTLPLASNQDGREERARVEARPPEKEPAKSENVSLDRAAPKAQLIPPEPDSLPAQILLQDNYGPSALPLPEASANGAETREPHDAKSTAAQAGKGNRAHSGKETFAALFEEQAAANLELLQQAIAELLGDPTRRATWRRIKTLALDIKHSAQLFTFNEVADYAATIDEICKQVLAGRCKITRKLLANFTDMAPLMQAMIQREREAFAEAKRHQAILQRLMDSLSESASIPTRGNAIASHEDFGPAEPATLEVATTPDVQHSTNAQQPRRLKGVSGMVKYLSELFPRETAGQRRDESSSDENH